MRPSGRSPTCTAPPVGGLFFPQSASLGQDRTDYSTAIQDKIVYAGTSHPSFLTASQDLAKVGELRVLPKQVERLCQRIGLERCQERDDQVAAYLALPLVQRKQAPAGVTPPPVAVVGTDGGRLQVRDDSWGSQAVPASPAEDSPAAQTPPTAAAPPPAAGQGATNASAEAEEKGPHWREDKVAVLMGMSSDTHPNDPCPQIPGNFVDPTRMHKLVRQLRKGVPVEQEPAAAAPPPDSEGQEFAAPGQPWQPPKMEHKRLVASRRNWDCFGPMVAAAAWAMGLFGSARRAFLGDGSENNWSVWRHYFGSFVPILDFIHARTYVHAAAHAGRSRVEGWRCYVRWIAWVWQGDVPRVLEELRQRQQQVGAPQDGDSDGHVRVVVARSLSYLQNNQGRMRYAEYRRQGLPITSSYAESAVKQINQRVKGTEKFWTEQGAEAMLQLRADLLSDDQPLDAFWQRRQQQTSGQRPYRRVA